MESDRRKRRTGLVCDESVGLGIRGVGLFGGLFGTVFGLESEGPNS